jgi:hypothetical protein
MAIYGAGPADHLGQVLEARLRPLLRPKQTGLRLDLERYLRYYQTERAHTGRRTRVRRHNSGTGQARPSRSQQVLYCLASLMMNALARSGLARKSTWARWTSGTSFRRQGTQFYLSASGSTAPAGRMGGRCR